VTIVVSVRVNDGIVLASDSATTFFDQSGHAVKVYNSANKIFNLVKGLPIGAVTYGAGGIGPASIATLSKDLRFRLDGGNADDPLSIDPLDYTLEEVASNARSFFLEAFNLQDPDEKPQNYFMGYRLAGYSTHGLLPEALEIRLTNDGCSEPEPLYAEGLFGPRWAGETEALDRLILGVGSRFVDALKQVGLEDNAARDLANEVWQRLRVDLHLPAMPIQDAIDFAHYLAETAVKFSQFSLRAPTVGGPIEIATITKHEGFKWVKRKHFYSEEFNR